MKRVAAGAYLPAPWVFEPAERPDDRADDNAERRDDTAWTAVFYLSATTRYSFLHWR